MTMLKCILTANRCYTTGATMRPKGVMVHSTGANNTALRRYVQPLKTDGDYDALIGKLGRNVYGNHWNRGNLSKCVHAFIGTLADGSVAAVQTLPWTRRGWHAGTGTTGRSANDGYISFEICEDNLKGAAYFLSAYNTAVELTAMLCKEYGLDPLADGVVIDHSEGYKRGIASGHGDVAHWFPRHGKSMDAFRKDVAVAMGVEEKKAEQAETVKLDYAKAYSKAYNKTYKVTASAGLNMRTGASTKKPIITALKKGTKFRCYGYYTEQADGTIWLYGIANGKTGFCSMAYLK